MLCDSVDSMSMDCNISISPDFTIISNDQDNTELDFSMLVDVITDM